MNSQELPVNSVLARACQATCSSCCKAGKIFLPNEECSRILNWIKKTCPEEEKEFQSRLEKHEKFCLYHQKSRCQFLDACNLCRLHRDGVKPRECFWWPLHVYVAKDEHLEIRVSTFCCHAFRHLTSDCEAVRVLEREVQWLGEGLIRRFRAVFPGSEGYKLLKTISASS